MSLAERWGSSRSRCSNQWSSSSGNRNDRTGPNFPEPLVRGIIPDVGMLVRVIGVGAVVRMPVRVDRSVEMLVHVRMIVRVTRIGVVVDVQRSVVVFVRQILFHGSFSRMRGSTSAETGHARERL
jgi:hypothetical protein